MHILKFKRLPDRNGKVLYAIPKSFLLNPPHLKKQWKRNRLYIFPKKIKIIDKVFAWFENRSFDM